MTPLKLAFVAISTAFAGMYLGSSLLGMIAISLAALSIAHQGHPLSSTLLSAVPAYNDMLTCSYKVENNKKNYVWIIKYWQPLAFNEFKYVYPISDVFFDEYSVQPVYKSWTDPSFNLNRRGTSNKGGIVFGESDKLAVPTVSTYTRPEGQPQFLQYIIMQFFYYVRDDSTKHAELLAKFKALPSKGQFRKYSNASAYSIVPRADAASNWSAPSAFV